MVPDGSHDPARRARPGRAAVHKWWASGVSGFLAGYSGLTRQAHELDLRQFASWCHLHQLHLFQARRADIEFFARDLEAPGPPSFAACLPSPGSTVMPTCGTHRRKSRVSPAAGRSGRTGRGWTALAD
jgi:hypothetical protein